MIRKRKCKFCGEYFSYEVGRGKDRVHCSKACTEKQGITNVKRKIKDGTYKTCSVDGCTKSANRVGAGLCEAHYMRMRRKGTTDKTTWQYKTTNPAGYIKLREPLHPLSDSTKTIYEHRYVYHEHYGDGPFECHWCGKRVTWFDMHVDHLDDNITNNNITNLVASCPACNQYRGRHKMTKKQRANGVQLTYNGRTMCVSEWASEMDISRTSLCARLKAGWTIERALTEPRGVTGPRPNSKKRNR